MMCIMALTVVTDNLRAVRFLPSSNTRFKRLVQYSKRANGSGRRGRSTSGAATVSFDVVSCVGGLVTSRRQRPYCACYSQRPRSPPRSRQQPRSNIKPHQYVLLVAFPSESGCLRERLGIVHCPAVRVPGPVRSALVFYANCTLLPLTTQPLAPPSCAPASSPLTEPMSEPNHA